MTIHPTSVVEDGAVLGAGVEIGPFCTVAGTAVLGEGVRLQSHAVVGPRTRIGARTVVHPQAVIGGEAQIKGNDAPQARLEVGADCVLREGVTLSLGSRKGGNLTTIGDRCFLMAFSHVGHDCHVGDDVTLANGTVIGGHSHIGDGVIMGGLAAVQQFARVGRYAFISGLSGVSADVIPYGIAIGLHVRLGGLNLIGLRRRKVPRANIHALRACFRFIFREQPGSIHDNARAAAQEARFIEVPEAKEMVDFILADAKRPIAPARKAGRGEDEAAD
ncbi:MAG TPA: acyl-ACP--UDP-N-acetylglucosamine O-acyltransferase [Rhizomicrobium sp.]|nr:acyl-ACP--UDP-N-acetylglucosamine O-acyltransferase [Rhizomicrobium sp.]